MAYLTLHPITVLQPLKSRCEPVLNRMIYRQPSNLTGSLTNSVLSLLGFTLILVGFRYITKATPFPGYWALLPAIGAACLICAGPHAWFNRVLLSNRIAVWIGLISYPLYLWHWPILVFARIMEGEVPSREIRIIAVLLSVALASLTYWFIEKPIRMGGKTKLKTIALTASMIAVGLVGGGTYFQDGLVVRYPSAIRNIYSSYPEKFKLLIKNSWREHSCFLDLPSDKFSSDCVDIEPIDTPLVYLWGDSHAAALYVGLRSFQDRYAFRIAQYTASSCPPLNDPNLCPSNNYQENLNRIRLLKPKFVILHAEWGKGNYVNLNLLTNTLYDIDKTGATPIVVGPVTGWVEGLPKVMLTYYEKNPLKILPARLDQGIDQNVWEVGNLVERLTGKEHAIYFSARQELCNEEGCIALIANEDLASYDTGHLSPSASKIVADSLLAKLFKSSFVVQKKKS